jgi:hypothetical protein
MPGQMLTTLIVVLLLLEVVIVGVGIYLAAYLKKKAQNLATREEFKELEKQTAALTRTTAQIEADIKGSLWDRQKQWELKREILFDAAKRVAQIENALGNLNSAFKTAEEHKSVPGSGWEQLLIDENDKWFKANAAFKEARLFVDVSCGQEMRDAFKKYVDLIGNVSYEISNP